MGRVRVGGIVLMADLAGTGVFAAGGVLAAIPSKLDLFGILVIAFVTALGGGILRDILLGAAPPVALGDQRYAIAVLVGAATAVLLGATVQAYGEPVLLTLDAAGLALFAVAGAEKALEFGSRPLTAAVLGTITATGGGAIRDVLLAGVPAILRVDFYTTAAFVGAAMLIAARRVGASARAGAVAGGCTCFLLRMLGAAFHWHLPTFG